MTRSITLSISFLLMVFLNKKNTGHFFRFMVFFNFKPEKIYDLEASDNFTVLYIKDKYYISFGLVLKTGQCI